MAVIFEEKTLSFAYDSTYGAYKNDSNPSLFVPVEGETYKIVWDGTEYVSTAFTTEAMPGMVLVGNTILIGGENTGEPFAMSSMEDGSGMTIFALDANETHTLAVYSGEEEPEESGKTVIMAEQELSGFFEEDGITGYATVGYLFTLANGEEYTVVWDGVEYTCTAVVMDSEDGSTISYIGNAGMMGEADTGEPFLMYYSSSEAVTIILTTDSGESHTVGIYQRSAEETPSGIVLKDHAGNDIIYEGVKSITVPTSDGGTKSFVAGNLVEKTVDLSMADGNMVIEAEEDTVLNKVTVLKPDTLIPENIAKDVEIGGVIGTLKAGGGSSSGYTVKVIDYDGTVITEEKIASGEVFMLPNPPAHERLVFDGWSASVPVADNTVTVEESDIVVGAMYRTASGATECDIYLNTATGLTFGFSSVLTGYTSIDWGDGVIDSSLSHTYDDYGEYTIKIYGMTKIASTSSSDGFIPSTYRELLVRCFIANTVTIIGDYALYLCYSLQQIAIPSGVTSIGTCAFHICYSLQGAVIPNGVTSVEKDAFYSCHSLQQIVIPSGVTSIGNEAFYSCFSLSNIVIPSSVTSIGTYAFYSCFSLSNIVIPSSVTSIGNNAFQYCRSLKSIAIPSGVTTIPTYAFQYCVSLKSIVIPSSVTSIGTYAFQQCNTLQSIAIPSGVTTVPAYAFQYFRACMTYDFSSHTKVPTLANTNAFSGIRITAKILVPASLYNSWKAASNWSTYANYIVAV